MKKKAPTHATKPMPKKRVLSRVLAEDLGKTRGGGFNTFTRCPIDTCDYDLD